MKTNNESNREIINSLLSTQITLEDDIANLTKQLENVKQDNRRLVQKNNDLIDKLNREYDKVRDLSKSLEIQMYTNITLENQLNEIKASVQEE